MMYRLRHIASGAVISTGSERRRDWFLRRGFALVGEPANAPLEGPLAGGTASGGSSIIESWFSGMNGAAPKVPYRELQKQAKKLGINARQKRPVLERLIAAAKE